MVSAAVCRGPLVSRVRASLRLLALLDQDRDGAPQATVLGTRPEKAGGLDNQVLRIPQEIGRTFGPLGLAHTPGDLGQRSRRSAHGTTVSLSVPEAKKPGVNS